MIKVELYLYDSAEREMIGTALNAIDARRLMIQQAMGGNAAPGQRVPDTDTPAVGDLLVASAAEAVVAKLAADSTIDSDTTAKTRRPRKKAEVVAAIAPEEPKPLEGDDAPMRPQTHGGALKSGGAPAPKKEETEVVVTTVSSDVLGEARTLLQKYAEKQGLPAASKLLAEYGAKRIGDVPPARLEAFMKRLA